MTNSKKIIILLFCCFLIFGLQQNEVVFAKNTKTQEEIENELATHTQSTLDELDLSALDRFLLSLDNNEKSFFSASSFKEKVTQILNGELGEGINSLGDVLIHLFFDSLLSFVPTLAIIVAISIISSLFSGVASKKSEVGEIVHLVCFGTIATIVVKYVCDFIALTSSVLASISSISDIVFPILLTLVATMGPLVSGNVYRPAVLIFSNYIIKLFSSLLISLFAFAFVFQILSAFSTKVKFKKFSEFFSSTFKWIIGTTFFFFMTYLALQGITASMFDGMRFKAAKFAVKNYVPLLGGYLSEGFDFILSSLSLVKDAVGISSMLLILCLVISPILKIAIFSLGLKLASGVCESVCDERISNFLSSTGKNLSMLVALIVGAMFMFLIISGLIVLTINLV